jgi:IS605 OrfB family transposase
MVTTTVSRKLKLTPNHKQKFELDASMEMYWITTNKLINYILENNIMKRLTSKGLVELFPETSVLQSSIRGEICGTALKFAKSHISKCREIDKKNKRREKKLKYPEIPVLKVIMLTITSQNYRLNNGILRFNPKSGGGKGMLDVNYNHYDNLDLNGKLGTITIKKYGGEYFAYVPVTKEIPLQPFNGNVLGIDVGLKVPAVTYDNATNRPKFYGNGRLNRYTRNYYYSIRRSLQKAGKEHVVKRISNKEYRVMDDRNHQISSDIIQDCVKKNITIIVVEKLKFVHKKLSLKYNRYMHSWNHGDLLAKIKYKAALHGIAVLEVNPAYTSQTCPVCGKCNKAEDRLYECSCGYHNHRDIVGAVNIFSAGIQMKDSQDLMNTACASI